MQKNNGRKYWEGRFSTLFSLLAGYILLSTLVRVLFLVWSAGGIGFQPATTLAAFCVGFVFDLAAALGLVLVYNAYLLLLPKRWIGSIGDRVFTVFYCFVIAVLAFFSLLAEITFWDEFGARFNFIAVDYLIYTYEVIENINQSYPLPWLIATLILLALLSIFLLWKKKIFARSFSDKLPLRNRAPIAITVFVLALALFSVLNNKMAEFSRNNSINEISKNGIFSFVAAFRSNELDYETFYPQLPLNEAYSIVRKNLLQENQRYTDDNPENINRTTTGGDSSNTRPNIVLVAIESFSADFLAEFGNTDQLTPFYDSLTRESIFFSNLYATGTRTVRGMEALVLSVPPTPGNSIVRRPDNQSLFSIASILKSKNYHPYFIYGGDGYFDNMNNFFGGQGFDIVDRNRGNPLSDKISTHRYKIPTEEVHFENAWGICDEDLYRQAIKYADKSDSAGTPFFHFIMTTSNHKPYTFPEGKINMPQGERNSAVRYTDYALQQFIQQARGKKWFDNTVFLIVADHCASSAGKWEINIDKHHIPAVIFNLKRQPERISRLVSQIDLAPTLFGYLGWTYNTELYGKDINQTRPGDERAFIGNYRTLGVLKDSLFTQIDDRKRVKQFVVSADGKNMVENNNPDQPSAAATISYYQTASDRFKNKKMKEK